MPHSKTEDRTANKKDCEIDQKGWNSPLRQARRDVLRLRWARDILTRAHSDPQVATDAQIWLAHRITARFSDDQAIRLPRAKTPIKHASLPHG